MQQNKQIRLMKKVQILIENTKTAKKAFYLMEAFSFALGSIAGGVLFKGAFLAVVTGIALMVLPIYYLMYKDKRRLRKFETELMHAMGQITNSYISLNDIQKSFERYIEEKNRFVLEKNRQTTVFDEFLAEIKFQSPSTVLALKKLGDKVDNKYFKEWIRLLILCQKNSELKFGLEPVVRSMNDQQNNEVEHDTAMAAAWQMFFLTIGACFALPPLMGQVNSDWYAALTKTTGGQILILLMIVAAVVQSFYVLAITKKKNEIM